MTPAVRIQRLAAELALSVEHEPVDPDKLRRTAEQLRAAAGAYLMELDEAERRGPSSMPEGRKAAQPITPRPVGQPKSGGAPPAGSAELQAKQKALDGTHLAPSPEEMRARIGRTRAPAGSPRDLIGELTSELDQLDQLLSSQTTATTPSLRATANHIQELAAKLR